MFKIVINLLFSVLFVFKTNCQTSQLKNSVFDHGKLIVSENQRYVTHSDGTPFFYLGDTGWELFHKLNRQEADQYLENRKQKGFNVIQAVALAEHGGITIPNAYGDLPLKFRSPVCPLTTPGNNPQSDEEYDYWDHVDYIVEKAAELGLYIGFLPSWGEWVTPRFGTYYFCDTVQSYQYGNFIGSRYAKAKNIIWILGGDRLADERKNGIDIWRSMAEGITDGVNGVNWQDRQADYSSTFMTYHCYVTSVRFFRNDPWIDVHTFGSYHEAHDLKRAYTEPEQNFRDQSFKPILNSEPAYEAHPVNYKSDWHLGGFDEFDVRQIAYWSVFSGAFGHTYGAHPIWIFHDPQKKNIPGFRISWKQALDLPGASQMVHLKNLMLSMPFNELLPDQTLIENQKEGTGYIVAIRSKSKALIYTPTGDELKIKCGVLTGKKITASWFNPKTGVYSPAGLYKNVGTITLNPAGEPAKGNDWVLVLENYDIKKK